MWLRVLGCIRWWRVCLFMYEEIVLGSMLGLRWVMCVFLEFVSSCVCLVEFVVMGRYVAWCNVVDFIFMWFVTLYVVV